MNWLIIKKKEEYNKELAIQEAIKAEAVRGKRRGSISGGDAEISQVLKTAISKKRADLTRLLSNSEEKIKDAEAISQRKNWEVWEKEEGIRQYIKQIKEDLKWWDANFPQTK